MTLELLPIQHAVEGAKPHSFAVMQEDGKALVLLSIEMIIEALQKVGYKVEQ